MFKIKENSDGTTHKHKARLVAKGFHQTAGLISLNNLVVKPTTIRIILTISLSKGWKVQQLYINNAFLNGDLKEEVYMEQPPEYQVQCTPSLVCKLHKAIYGLRQAPRACFEKLYGTLLSFGFISVKSDQSLFILLLYIKSISWCM